MTEAGWFNCADIHEFWSEAFGFGGCRPNSRRLDLGYIQPRGLDPEYRDRGARKEITAWLSL
jgi:hypothetical protein